MTTWTAFDEDETRGIAVMKKNPHDGTFLLDGHGERIPDDVTTDRLRASLSDFLVCLGTYGPEHFMHTVVEEATSYNWVIDKIKATFKLDTKGMGFLAGSDLKMDYGEEGQTFAQGLQATREFYCNSLQKKGTKYKGKELEKNEPLTPLGENFIVETWLNGIHPKAKAHIMQTRGHMITDDRPNLYDIQQQLCEQMDTILQEITMGSTGPSVNRAGFPPQGNPRRFPPQAPRPRLWGVRPPGPRPSTRPSTGPPGRPTAGTRPPCPPDTCFRCYETGRYGPATKNHYANECPHPRKPQPMRILVVNQNQQSLPQIQEIQLQPNVLDQSQPGPLEAAQEDDYQESHAGYEEQPEVYDVNSQYWNKDYYYYHENNLNSDANSEPPNSEALDGQLITNSNRDEPPSVNLIPTRSMQKFSFLCNNSQATLAIDSGCEAEGCMSEAEAIRLGIEILPLDKEDLIPNQADGKTPLHPIGQATTTFDRDKLKLSWHGYILKNLSQPILCGASFISRNNIVQHINKNLMMVGQKVILEDPPLYPGNNLPFTIQEVNMAILSNIEVGDKVPQGIKHRLNQVHTHHAAVFDGDLTAGYNGHSGDFDVDFDFNNNLPPPSHKGSTPSYYKKEDEMVLQEKIEELERQNVVAKVSELGINLKCLQKNNLC